MARAQRKSGPSNIVPLHLVPPQQPAANKDTVDTLWWLLGEAMAGRVRGLASVAVYEDGKQCALNTCGTADENLVHTIGALSVLVSDLADRVRQSSEN